MHRLLRREEEVKGILLAVEGKIGQDAMATAIDSEECGENGFHHTQNGQIGPHLFSLAASYPKVTDGRAPDVMIILEVLFDTGSALLSKISMVRPSLDDPTWDICLVHEPDDVAEQTPEANKAKAIATKIGLQNRRVYQIHELMTMQKIGKLFRALRASGTADQQPESTPGPE